MATTDTDKAGWVKAIFHITYSPTLKRGVNLLIPIYVHNVEDEEEITNTALNWWVEELSRKVF